MLRLSVLGRSLFLAVVTLLGNSYPVLAQEPPPTLRLPNQEETQRALKSVKEALIEELKLEHNLGPNSRLAARLSQLQGEQLGNFFGSVAGGDANSAFDAIGGIGADLFLNDLQDKWENLEFEGKGLLAYVPVDAGDCKQILIDLWWVGGEQAAIRAEAMVRQRSMESLTKLSRDAIAGALDWVLKDTLEKAPGAHFLKLVEIEVWMLGVADRYQDKVLLNKLADAQAFYNERRRTQGPAQAFDAVQDRAELGVYSHALFEKHQDLPALFESRFRRTFAGEALDARIASLRNQKRRLAITEAQAELRAEVERIRRLAREKLAAMADADDAVRTLHQANSAIQRDLARMRIALAKITLHISQLSGAQRRIGAASIELQQLLKDVNPDAGSGQKTLAELVAATPESIQRVEQWDAAALELKDQVRDLRDSGRRLSQKVRDFCSSTSGSTDERRKRGLLLIKEIRELSVSTEEKFRRAYQEAVKLLAAIRSFQLVAQPMRHREEPIKRLLAEIQRLETQLEDTSRTVGDAESDYGVASASCANMIAELRKALGTPENEKLACEEIKLEYDRQMKGDQHDPGLRSQVANALDIAKKELDELTPQLRELTEFRSKLRNWLDDASKPLEFDCSKSHESVRHLQSYFEGYQGGLRTLIRTARQCAQLDPSEVMKADLAEARRLLNEAREHGGQALDRRQDLELIAEHVQTEAEPLVALQKRTAGVASQIPDALADCAAIKQQQQQGIDADLRAAVASADREFSTLQQHHQRTAALVGLLRGMQEGVSRVKDSVQCDNLSASADRTARLVEDTANLGQQSATMLSAIYDGFYEQGRYAPLGAPQRNAHGMYLGLRSLVPESRAALSRTNALDLHAWHNDTQRHWNEMRQHGHEASWRTERITLLLRPYLEDWKEPPQLQAEADKVAEIVARRLKETKPMVDAILNALPAAGGARTQIQRVLPELEAALGTLRDCCTTGPGFALTQLARYDSDAAEWRSKFKALAIEARDIADSIGAYCRTRFPAALEPDGTPLQPIPSPPPPDLSDLFAGTDRDLDPEDVPADDSPDLSDLFAGVDQDDRTPPPPVPVDPQSPIPAADRAGVYQLARIASAVSPRVEMPVILRWRILSDQRAEATLEVSRNMTPEMRADLTELGIPPRMQFTAHKQDGVYIVSDENFKQLSQKVLTAMARIGNAIGDAVAGVASFGATESDQSVSVQVHTAIMRVAPGPANNLEVDFHYDYTISSSSERQRQSNRVQCIGLRR